MIIDRGCRYGGPARKERVLVRTYRDDLTWKIRQLLKAEGYRFCDRSGYFTGYAYENPERVFGLVPKDVRIARHLGNLFMGEPPWIATVSLGTSDTPMHASISVHGDSFAERVAGVAELLRSRLGVIAEVAVATPYTKFAGYYGD